MDSTPSQQTISQNEVLDIAGAAQLLQLSRATVYALARSGKIPTRKIGRMWRFSRRALVAWVEDSGNGKTDG